MDWMIYGATGYTGVLLVEEALRRGHRPMLAGRNPDKLQELADKYELEYMAFRLDDMSVVAEATAEMELVLHAAGPFIHTSEPMIKACLATKTNYLDISGEISVLERSFSYDDTARKNGIAILSGSGFDVVPSDCLAVHVSQRVRGATLLETGIASFSGASVGTTVSALEMIPNAWLIRKEGKLVQSYFAEKTTSLTLPNGKKRSAASVPWGDLSVAYRSTGIPNIVSYLALPPSVITAGRLAFPIGRLALKSRAIMNLATNFASRFANAPSEAARENDKAYIWAKASRANDSYEAWLETAEPYAYTAKIAVLAVERVLEYQPIGALSPSQAFGVDFALEVEGTKLFG
jgi:short subunit dehydrogenase-like uncharacterized protein